MEVSICCKIVEYSKISIKMKNCETFYKAQTVIRLNEIIQPSTSVEHKVSYGDRDIQKSTDICLQE